MSTRPILLLVLLVVLPLGLLAWLGTRLANQERALVEDRIRELLAARLRDLDETVQGQLELLATDLQSLTDLDDFGPDTIRELVRNDPRLFQLFVLDGEGLLIHPDPTATLSTSERDFILRASQVINNRLLVREAERESDAPALAPTKATPDSSLLQEFSTIQQTLTSVPVMGGVGNWFVWYWGPGTNLIYWQRRPSGEFVGAALDRSRWLADLIASLPDTPATAADSVASIPARFRIVESGKNLIYEWGTFNPAADDEPAAEIRFSGPLSAFQLQQFVPREYLSAAGGRSAHVNLLAGLGISALGLIALAWVFYQSYARDMREAARRVSFVNQVSHELRTPLTNIRMYAELLDGDLQRLNLDEDQPRGRLAVILAESQRLTRLIGNVLTFAKQERSTRKLSLQQQSPDQIIREVVDSFRPALAEKGIEVELRLGAGENIPLDQDSLEQILCNLISNVEKYASAGRWLSVSSERSGELLTIDVSDRGPGIAQAQREKIFDPFWRSSDDLHQAAGTGIGLTIARELARQHGGNVVVVPAVAGATFRVTLHSPNGEEQG